MIESEYPKLTFVDSNHEQRELSIKIIPEKGWWFEEGKFWRNVERFDIHNRWKCVDQIIDKENEKIIVKLKLMDHNRQQKRVDDVAKKVIEKHRDILTASLLKTVIKGVYENKQDIEEFVEHAKRTPDLEARDRYVGMLKVKERLEKRKKSLENMKKKVESDTQLLKELEEEDGQWLANEH